MLRLYPAVIIRSFDEAVAAMLPGLPVTLISEPGAALYAGCGWWRALVSMTRTAFPATPLQDVLDCADGSGQALAALRNGQHFLVLHPTAPGWEAVRAIATGQGRLVLAERPPTLDLGRRGALRQLERWLVTNDNHPGLE